MELGRIGKYLIDNLILIYTVILSNFRKTRTKDRIVSYRIIYSLKIPKKKQRIKLSNLFQIKIKNKNF
jgi:hypothetical protein